jgi:hypothetical protein
MMTSDQIKDLIEISLNQIFIIQWWHYLIWLVVTAIGAFIGTYLHIKGRNLATKEDIGKITTEIEKVKLIYTKEIEYIRHKQQLRLAAIDKRLRTHQTAYSMWRKLVSNIENPDKIGTVILDCHMWWIDNCLYLAPEPRESFRKALDCAANLKDFLQDRANNIRLIEKNREDIRRAGEDIVKATGLPSMGDYELKNIEEREPNKLVEVTPTAER